MNRTIHFVLLILAARILCVMNAGAQTNRITFNGQNLFLSGANIAWRNYANDVGPNANPDMNYFSSIFSQVRSNGGNCLRLWVHIHGGNSPVWSGNTVTGPGMNTISDLKKILDCAMTNKVGLILCLWSFDMLQAKFNTSFPGLTTRSYAILTNDVYRGSYLTNALIPMVSGLKGHPAIVCWEIFNEPEGMTPQFGWSDYRVDISYVQKFVNQCAGVIHRTDPSAKVSNGAWALFSSTDVTLPGSAAPNNLNYYRDDRLIAAGGDTNGTLDFYMVHYYDWAGGANRSPFQHDASTWGLTKPVVVAEFSFVGCTNCGTNFHIALHDRGYAGALDWSFTDESPTAILAQIAGMSTAYPADVLIVTNGHPPSIATLISPTNNAVFPPGSAITLAATASASGGATVTNVQFYSGNTLLGGDATPPYQFIWSNPPDATYQLTAVATDNGGESTVSAPVSFRVGNAMQQTRFEAEVANLTTDLTVVSDATASGGKYVNMQASGTGTWLIPNVPSGGTYQLTIGYKLPYGTKQQNLLVNGGTPVTVSFDGATGTWLAKTVSVNLNAGTNQVAIVASWGYMYFDYLELPLPAQTPVTIINYTLLPSGGLQIVFNVPAGVAYTIENSTDLRIWSTLYSGAGSSGAESYSDSGAIPASSRFYRIRL